MAEGCVQLPNAFPAHRKMPSKETVGDMAAKTKSTSQGHGFSALALAVSDTRRAQEAAEAVAGAAAWAPLDEAEAVVVLGGDGFMLQVLHQMLDKGRLIPAYGLNLGTVGFLMNGFKNGRKLIERINKSRIIAVDPLRVEATTRSGETVQCCAINEVSLLRETRQTAKIEVGVNGRVRIPELSCDGVLLATPAGSTAYNLSANGPILPLDSKTLALTPISPFRPRRWRGAILPDRSRVSFRVLDPEKRPVAAVADQREIRDIAEVHIEIARDKELTLLFDPGHSLDERIVTEQFIA